MPISNELINKTIASIKANDGKTLDNQTITLLHDSIPALVSNNDAAATYLYALMYKQGLGAPQDREEYIRYLVKAIILGRKEAENDFEDFFAESQNYMQMRQLIKTIADSGNYSFAAKYAFFCEHSSEENKDIKEAIKYYEIAARSGSRDYKRAANRLKEPDERLKVKQPYFFKIMYNGKIAYLLGTIHIVGWNVFPPAMQEIIKNCNGVISESSPFHISQQPTKIDSYLSKHKRQATDLDWFSLLPLELKNLCSQIWQAHLNINPLDISNVADVKITILEQHILRLGLTRNKASEILEDALETQYTNPSNIYGKMDFDIEDIIAPKGGLEEGFIYDNISTDADEEEQEHEEYEESAFAQLLAMLLIYCTENYNKLLFEKLIHDLENSLQPLLSKSTKFKDLFRKFISNKHEFNDPIKQDLLDIWEQYANGSLLYDLNATLTQEQEELFKEGNVMSKRNAIMFNNALHFITNLEEPILITCGINHLLGRTGLLSRLGESGATIELYNSATNSFTPYVYPYKYYLMGLENIKKGMFFSSASKPNSTAIIPYNSQQQFSSKFKPT